MTINIDEKTLKEIMTACVKEEIDFLTRVALRREYQRKVLWTAMGSRLNEACIEAGLSPTAAGTIAKDTLNQSAPSGGGGGSDPNDGDSGKSGGGGWKWIDDPKKQDPSGPVQAESVRKK